MFTFVALTQITNARAYSDVCYYETHYNILEIKELDSAEYSKFVSIIFEVGSTFIESETIGNIGIFESRPDKIYFVVTESCDDAVLIANKFIVSANKTLLEKSINHIRLDSPVEITQRKYESILKVRDLVILSLKEHTMARKGSLNCAECRE